MIGDIAEFEGFEEGSKDLGMSEESINHYGTFEEICRGCIYDMDLMEVFFGFDFREKDSGVDLNFYFDCSYGFPQDSLYCSFYCITIFVCDLRVRQKSV